MRSRPRVDRRGGSLIVAALVLSMVVGSSLARATPLIMAMSSNVDRGMYYDATAQQWNWTDRQVTSGAIVAEDYSVFFFEGTVDWTSDLDQDLSGLPLWLPGRANVTFLGGGTLTVTGTFRDVFQNELYTGLLFEAGVSAFELLETEVDSDNLDTVGEVLITPSTGYLVADPANTYALLGPQYSFALSFPAARSESGGPGHLHDFRFNVWALAGSQWIMAHQEQEPGAQPLGPGPSAIESGVIGCRWSAPSGGPARPPTFYTIPERSLRRSLFPSIDGGPPASGGPDSSAPARTHGRVLPALYGGP